MTITIKYHEKIANETLTSYTSQWATNFGNILWTTEVDYTFNASGYSIPPADSIKYVAASTHHNQAASNAAIVVALKKVEENDQQPTAGISVSLEFGEALVPIVNDGMSKQPHQLLLQQVQLDISGLDIRADVESSMPTLDYALWQDIYYQGGNELGIYNLLKGNANPLLNILKAQGINVDTPLKNMVIASQLEMTTDTPVIDTVGMDNSDMLLVA
ncbi:hemophore [Yersinia aldovae ATCC 35236]|uniref:Hemophore n=1 Tax=Yersinia aldovae TaxID=29483 RepID=A0A0T9ULQ6_YERAL|nr:heme acquisition protein HasA [Yersinia aldovae]EEP94208.1 hemophore [Yersinia aldovae ATCC 35236]CNK00605.1 hemophore [Yersinia aldovae]CNL51658.1 hemophore [Yersinia aldovae]